MSSKKLELTKDNINQNVSPSTQRKVERKSPMRRSLSGNYLDRIEKNGNSLNTVQLTKMKNKKLARISLCGKSPAAAFEGTSNGLGRKIKRKFVLSKNYFFKSELLLIANYL